MSGHCALLEGQGDLVSRLRTPETHIVAQTIPIINPLSKSPLTVQVYNGLLLITYVSNQYRRSQSLGPDFFCIDILWKRV